MEKIKQFFKKIYGYFLQFVVLLSEIDKDKYMHFIAGVVITGCMAFFPKIAPFGWLAGVLAGAVKECIDQSRGGVWDGEDFIATLAGSLVCQIFIWIYLLVW